MTKVDRVCDSVVQKALLATLVTTSQPHFMLLKNIG
jgi:hypothetical protein